MEETATFNCPACHQAMTFGQVRCPACGTSIFYRNLSEDYWNQRKRKLLRQTAAISQAKH